MAVSLLLYTYEQFPVNNNCAGCVVIGCALRRGGAESLKERRHIGEGEEREDFFHPTV